MSSMVGGWREAVCMVSCSAGAAAFGVLAWGEGEAVGLKFGLGCKELFALSLEFSKGGRRVRG